VKLVSTKRTPKKKDTKPEICAPDPYPYNTRLCLDKDVMDRLNLSPKDFKVGQKVDVTAVATVKSLRQVEGKEYETSEIELQITEIGIDKRSASAREAIDKAIKEAS
jgi:hypothetical protein